MARPIKAARLPVLMLLVVLVISTALIVHVEASTSSLTLFGRINSPSGWGSTSSTVSSPGPDITVLPGETLDAIVHSGDLVTHNWGVDYNGDGVINAGEPQSNTTTTSTSFTFTATTTPGIYTYWCFIHKGPMTGRFIVESPDFSITPNPSSLSISQGSSQTSALTVSSLNGFSGTVTFTTPTSSSGITASLSSSSVSVTPTTPGLTTLDVTVGSSTAPSQYTVSITGSGGGNMHTTSVTVTVVVPDFAVSPSQSSVSILVGSSGNTNLTLTSQNGFAGSVTLTATVSPTGPTVTFNPATISLTSGGSAISTLTITTSSGPYSSTSAGTYTVTVKAIGGSSLSHTTTISLTLAPQSSPAAGIPAYVLLISGVVIVAAGLVVAFVVLRRRPGR